MANDTKQCVGESSVSIRFSVASPTSERKPNLDATVPRCLRNGSHESIRFGSPNAWVTRKRIMHTYKHKNGIPTYHKAGEKDMLRFRFSRTFGSRFFFFLQPTATPKLIFQLPGKTWKCNTVHLYEMRQTG